MSYRGSSHAPGLAAGHNEGNLKPSKKGQRPPGRPKGSKDSKTRQSARDRKDIKYIAQRLLSDAVYRKNLLKRLRDGTAGPVENLLYLYAHDKPRERRDLEDFDKKLAEMRKNATQEIQKARPRLVRDNTKLKAADEAS